MTLLHWLEAGCTFELTALATVATATHRPLPRVRISVGNTCQIFLVGFQIFFSVWSVDLSCQQLAHGHDAQRVSHEHGDDGEERDEAELGAAEGGGVQAAVRGAKTRVHIWSPVHWQW